MRLLHVATLSLLLILPSLQAVSTPDDSEGSEAGIAMSHTQNYIDMSDEAIESDSRPEIVLIMLIELESEDAADRSYDEFSTPSTDGTNFTVTEIDDIGDEAIFVESVDEGGDHGAWVVARTGSVVIMVFVAGAPYAPEISTDITRFILKSGPSDAPPTVDSAGVVTGGWADAFPLPTDIQGLATFTPASVTEMPEDEVPPATPSESTPVLVTPAA